MTADAALADLVQAIRDERAARERLDDARIRLAAALDILRAERVPATLTAIRVAKALGAPLSLRDRQRLADALRQRRSRALRARTDRHEDHAAPPSALPTAAVGSAARAITPGEEPHMARKLIRRTVTEEYVREPDTDEDEIEEEGLGEPEDGEEIEDESPHRRRGRKARE